MIAARVAGGRPAWDDILSTEHWGLLHAYDSRLVGWLILVTLEHRDTLAAMTDDEADELGRLTRDISVALADITGCPKTYLAQFAENPDHPHVHVHLVARPSDLAKNRRGPRAFALLGADDHERVSENEMNELALALRAHEALAKWAGA